MAQRITEDFVKHFDFLVNATGNRPTAIKFALEKESNLAISIRELHRIWNIIEFHRKNSRYRYIAQAHPNFNKCLNEFRTRWRSVHMELLSWEFERDNGESLAEFLDREIGLLIPGDGQKIISESSSNETQPGPPEHWYDDDVFDPDNDSASELIDEAIWFANHHADEFPLFEKTQQAHKWFCNVVLDFRTFEEKWKDFPIFVVQERVSDSHGLTDKRSLYAYLHDIRAAYCAGAVLAAIAMCRSATEILIREHYNNLDTCKNTHLIPLIKATQKARKNFFMKNLNLIEKVESANVALHADRQDIKNTNPLETLIKNWVLDLQVLIDNAP